MRRLLLGLLITGAALAVGLQPAFASPAVHIEEDVTGAVFTCSDANYTIISGSVRIVIHEVNANTGGTAFTDTEKFQIIQQATGSVGSVNLTTHISPNGDFKSFDFGNCVPPED